jgi:hypothetical protein
MAIAHKVTPFDRVELIERIDDAPAGARGAVLELYRPEVEIFEPELGGAARIIFAPLDKLRVIEPSPKSS